MFMYSQKVMYVLFDIWTNGDSDQWMLDFLKHVYMIIDKK